LESRKNYLKTKDMTQLQELFNHICNVEGITPSEALKKTRKREIVQVRQKYFKIAQKNNLGSSAKIGKVTGQDHATVIHGIKTVNNLIDVDKQFRESYKRLEISCCELFDFTKSFEWKESGNKDGSLLIECFYHGLRIGAIDRLGENYYIVTKATSTGIVSDVEIVEDLPKLKTEIMQGFLSFKNML